MAGKVLGYIIVELNSFYFYTGASTSTGFTNSTIELSMHELYNETIRDLLKENGQDASHEGNMTLDVSAEKGLHVKVG